MDLRVLNNSNDGWTQIGDRELPTRFTLSATNTDGSPNLRLDFAVRDGVSECVGVHIESADAGRAVQVSDLRSVKIEDWLEYAVSRVLEPVEVNDEGMRTSTDRIDQADIERRIKLLRQVRGGPRRMMTDEMLREVASIYRANVDNNPTQMIAEHFDKSPRSARLYVREARRRKFLGDAIPGKAGER